MTTHQTQTPQAPALESYIVLNEHTLGFVVSPNIMEVLSGPVLKGGHDPFKGPVFINPETDQLRPATLADFAEYRVCPRGHLFPI
ncbi:hypothetical protein [Marinobacter salsuginis]|uniref:Uncharacterized protein n=1 Tax=Marinobacter salsuginis TaxID=418719 RepID=A0A5M3Q399_9GAMM|nr:hypothetical protein [Marinobacter salsuginis]GBO89130.1 hypothetical protein MSSD14B_27980 [Marinobacter salsuginis]